MAPTHRSLATKLAATTDGDGHEDGQHHRRRNPADNRPLRVAHLRYHDRLVLAARLVHTPGIRAVDVAVVHVLRVDTHVLGTGERVGKWTAI